MSRESDSLAVPGAVPQNAGFVATRFHWGDACAAHEAPAPGPLRAGCTVVICTHHRPCSLIRFLDSLKIQTRTPDRLVIVDASPDAETEAALCAYPETHRLASCVLYFRVSGELKGLTRQRNFAIRWVETDLTAFFDDDVVLAPDCLSEMERTHRALGETVVGVGAMQSGYLKPRALWRWRRKLGIVPSLQPGRYSRSGMSIPWSYLHSSAPTEGDWLPGCGMMWKTEIVAELGFHDAFEGYAQGEDLDFSLRALRKGKLVMAPTARLKHLHDPAGRQDEFRAGYSSIYNRYEIHRRSLPNRTWRDVAWFIYAWTFDTLLLLRHLVNPRLSRAVRQQIAGRLRATRDLLARRKQNPSPAPRRPV
jgi:GT2 family glycosyltransferase